MSSLFPMMDDDEQPIRRERRGEGRRDRGSRRKRRGRLTLAIAGGFVLAVILLGVAALLLALDARTAYAELQAAMPQVTQLRAQVLAGENDVAAATSEELQEHTSAARDAVHGPHWTLAGLLPVVGPNVDAAQAAAVVVDDLATGVLPDLVAVTAVVNPASLAPVDGRIDVAALSAAAPQVVAANDAVAAAAERMDAVSLDGVHERLRGPLEDLQVQLDEVSSLTQTAARAVQLVPPMLGAEGPREYLLMVQNNSEPRSTGGLTGAFVHLRADAGAIELVDQGPAGFLGSYPEPAVELTPTEVSLFGTQIGRYPGNITATPDFPRSAQIAQEMWRQSHGSEIDGVFSVDPVALGSLLTATGPVGLPTGDELTAENAAAMMLNGVYLQIPDPDMQNLFFQAAAGTIFSHVMSGAGSPVAAVGALTLAAEEGRLLVWSAHPEEQELLAGTVLSGELRGHAGDSPVVGVYLNDLSGAKVAYYQRMDATVTAATCRPDGSQDLTLAVTLSNDAPAGAADLPVSLVGNGDAVEPGGMRSNVLVYAPTGGRITDVRASNGEPDVLPQIHDDLVVAARRIVLSPGETVTTEYDITTGPGLDGEVDLRLTPGPGDGKFTSSGSQCS
ncbi:DUF4012 domain-containing protein [Georgenia faecalis]|uniref:DUF4012 domain-containing protein n=1 Tax=Georgenia faecalis TaxID=2483799 RepID=A0ABV9D6G4_9MICO|nr:DUF4012 domain-containing protein [Georgenia faecalis]